MLVPISYWGREAVANKLIWVLPGTAHQVCDDYGNVCVDCNAEITVNPSAMAVGGESGAASVSACGPESDCCHV